MLNADWKYLLLFLILWAIAILIIGPFGDFPLNDDWHYGLPVLHLYNEGVYSIDSAFAPNIFFHVAWGFLFCKIGGSFDFTWLRYSVIFWGIAATLSFYALLRHQELKPNKAFGVALLLFFNPVFFLLSFSFMTDVPFLALSILSILFYVHFLQKQQPVYRLGGFLAAILAFLIRQPGLLLPLAFELALLVNQANKKQLYYFMSTLVLLLSSYYFVETFVKPAVGRAAHYIAASNIYLSTLLNEPASFAFRLLKYNTMSVFYIGLFTFPLLQKIGSWALSKLAEKWLALLLLINLALTITLFSIGRIFPYGGNILYNVGLGPLLLSDVRYFGAEPFYKIPLFLIIPFGLLCQMNGCFLLIMLGRWLIDHIKRKRPSTMALFFIILVGLYMPLMTVFSFFDRFLLLPLALIIMVLVVEKKEFFQKLGVHYQLTMLIFIIFSILGTKDYLNWNRAANTLYRQLLVQKIPASCIDGGVSNNGFHIFNTGNFDADYIISFTELPGYSTIMAETYKSSLFRKEVDVVVQKCDGAVEK